MTRAAPNIEERLTSAAFEMLTDENRHSDSAQAWAVRFLRTAAHGRPTAFQRRVHAMSAAFGIVHLSGIVHLPGHGQQAGGST